MTGGRANRHRRIGWLAVAALAAVIALEIGIALLSGGYSPWMMGPVTNAAGEGWPSGAVGGDADLWALALTGVVAAGLLVWLLGRRGGEGGDGC